VEFLTILAETRPGKLNWLIISFVVFVVTNHSSLSCSVGLLRKYPGFVDQLLPILAKMMSNIEDDDDWNENNDEDDEGLLYQEEKKEEQQKQ
jgi:hypothetical protein